MGNGHFPKDCEYVGRLIFIESCGNNHGSERKERNNEETKLSIFPVKRTTKNFPTFEFYWLEGASHRLRSHKD